MENQIKSHYNTKDLKQIIFRALEKAGKNIDQLSLKDLAPIDQLHTGGAAATQALLEQACLHPGSEVLDAGCGMGGSSRLMAKTFQHIVTGIDLSDQFIDAARTLTDKLHLSDQVYFHCGSILNLPFTDESFDAILCQHILMNIEDKKTVFKEFERVLRKKGRLIVHEIVKGENEPILYPVPWAAEKSICFMTSRVAMEQLMEAAGFEKQMVSDWTPQAADWWARVKKATDQKDAPQRVLGPHLVFGENAALFGKTMSYNLKWNRIKAVEAIFRKKG
jgi:sarcosine/dimethylglycine N-methyltransferase